MTTSFTDKLGIRIPDIGTLNWADEMNDNLELTSSILSNIQLGNTVKSGLVASDGGVLQLDYTSGVVNVGGTEFAVGAGNKTATELTTQISRQRNFLYVDNAGVVQISITAPSGQYALLAMADCDETEITAVYDCRSIEIVTPESILADLITVGGAGSGLDADLLDGEHGSFYRSAANLNAGLLPAARFDDTAHGARTGGTLHAVAVAGVSNGFMSAADKTNLDAASAGSVKAWVNFNGTGTVAIRDSLNVSSITDVSTGVFTVNLITSMGNTDFAVIGNVGPKHTTRGAYCNPDTNTVVSSTTVRTGGYWYPGANSYAALDFETNSILIIGD